MAIKKINIKKQIRFISVTDDAIDREKSDLDSYQNHYDEFAVNKYIVFKDGMQPTWFTRGILSSTQRSAIQDKHQKYELRGETKYVYVNSGAMAEDYFRYVIKNIEDPDIVFETEKIGGVDVVHHNIVKVMSDRLLQEVAVLVLRDNQLSEEEKKTQGS